MKKVFMILCMALMSVGAFADKGDVWGGVTGSYDPDLKNIGLGAKVQWECLKHFRLETAVKYNFPNSDDDQSYMAAVSAHYLIKLNNHNFNLYPIIGGAYRNEKSFTHIQTQVNADGTVTQEKSDPEWDSAFNIQMGVGLEFPISDKLKIGAECIYYYLDDYPVPSVSLLLKL